ncbi:MAG TPA: fumarylacetoacetate hydrolase family protein [Thermoanaerobaculia bacterium]|nr:fumarylacetoacetate hydrolase family protein [Thermoanaerobaculia bacterium]
MKIYRYLDQGRAAVGVQVGDRIQRYTGTTAFDLGVADEGHSVPLSEAVLLPPAAPGKIVAVGRNYADHAKELGNDAPPEPIIFLKPPSALLPPGGTIIRPAASQRVDYEGELVIVIGRKAKNVNAADWREYVRGFTCANDVTARDLQKKDVQFTRGKSFDTFCPIGPCIDTGVDPADLTITTRLNGVVKQQASTKLMIFPVSALLAFVSGIMTLDPGDIILTGTPAGVGPMDAGDSVEVEIEGIGVLKNSVR